MYHPGTNVKSKKEKAMDATKLKIMKNVKVRVQINSVPLCCQIQQIPHLHFVPVLLNDVHKQVGNVPRVKHQSVRVWNGMFRDHLSCGTCTKKVVCFI